MKINWKNKLKAVLEKNAFSEVSTNSPLTKADKSPLNLVLSAFVSVNLADTSENFKKSKTSSPLCSNCNLPLNLIENGTLWFCPLGCESRKAE
jgi:hypothetical protein